MSVTYVASGAVANSSTTTIAVPYPAGLAAGDILLLQRSDANSTNGIPATPSGWTAITADQQVGTYAGGIFLKVATGSESGSLSLTSSNTSAIMHAFRGADNTTPQDVAAYIVTMTVGAASVVLSSITAATAGALPVWLGSTNIQPRTFTSTGTEIFDGGTQTSGFAYYDTAVGAPGAIGSRTVTFAGGNARAIAALILLRPASGGGAPPATNPIMTVV